MKPYRARILAIDDTPANLITLGVALDTEYEVQFATSGLIGIAQALANPPDLILLDVMMPEIDGFETYKRLHAQSSLKDIPVIFVTALDDFDSEVAGLQLGAADYITKPIKVAVARQRIHNLLEREQLRKEVQRQRDQLAKEVQRRSQTEDQLRKLNVAVEQSPASVAITDLDACLEYVNPRFSVVTGYSAHEVIGHNPRILQSGLTSQATYLDMWDKLANGKVWKGELINRRKNGEVYWEESQIAPITNAEGKVTHYVAIKTDISERKAMEEQVRQLAFYDSLTGLPNRRLLSERLGQTMVTSKRSGCYGALIFLDLDNFKPLNDLHGHNVGDLLLIEVTRRLTTCVREMDTVARFGGDEFIVILSELDVDKAASIEQASGVAEKIHSRLAEPYLLSVKQQGLADRMVEHRCSASIGVVAFINHEASQEEIIKRADAAMYLAKEAGRNLIRYDET